MKLNFFKKLNLVFITDEVRNLLINIRTLKKEKKAYLIWFILLPFTTIFLIENLFIYLFFLLYYWLLFLFKIINLKIFKKKFLKPIKINSNKPKKEYIFVIILKNLFWKNPRNRAFLTFYIILEKMFNTHTNNKKELIMHFLNFFKIYLNKIFFYMVVGLPFIVINCNTKLVKKLYLIEKVFPFKESNFLDYFLNIFLNINRDILSDLDYMIDFFKIKFENKKIIFNPGIKNLKK